jgi:hypothetical protein
MYLKKILHNKHCSRLLISYLLQSISLLQPAAVVRKDSKKPPLLVVQRSSTIEIPSYSKSLDISSTCIKRHEYAALKRMS